MKRALGYVRISDKDQSNFSITGQEKYIREYADKHKIELFSMFTDDGKSAKNFDRPDWKKLECFIAEHFRSIDFLIVIKYDRFSRNAAEGLNKIELLEKKYKIIIISVFEQMHIDYDSPFFFKQRADMLVNAEFELHVIRDRTKFGMHEALRSGRYVSKAPRGYINSRDESNKPIILPDADLIPVIQNVFTQFLAGFPLKTIYLEARKKGLKLNGHSAVTRILDNCTYAGLINVPAYRKDVTKYVKGIHQPMIEESTWRTVQSILHAKHQPKLILNEEVPLRGVLKCTCGKPVTAGNSKGKKNYYWYYKCSEHTDINLSANKLHLQLMEVLKHFSYAPAQIEYLYAVAEQKMSEKMEEGKKRLAVVQRDHAAVKNNLNSLEEKFILNQINAETYSKWYNSYKTQEAACKFEIEQLTNSQESGWKNFREQLPKITDVPNIYNSADLLQKQSFLKGVFNSQLTYSEGVYRTPYLLPLFSHNALILKEKRLLIIEQPLEKSVESSTCAPGGT